MNPWLCFYCSIAHVLTSLQHYILETMTSRTETYRSRTSRRGVTSLKNENASPKQNEHQAKDMQDLQKPGLHSILTNILGQSQFWSFFFLPAPGDFALVFILSLKIIIPLHKSVYRVFNEYVSSSAMHSALTTGNEACEREARSIIFSCYVIAVAGILVVNVNRCALVDFEKKWKIVNTNLGRRS